MNENGQIDNKSDIEFLKDFIHENEELEKLESIIDRFNIFRSLNIIDNEIRHSNFLAWLLDPSETHGLGDYFLNLFLKKISSQTSSVNHSSPSIFEIDSWTFNYIEVLREWKNIDILIKSDENRFVCVIENKIKSSEGKDQLQRYKKIINHEFGDYKKFFVYLSLEGDIPSDENYLTVSYRDISAIINYIIEVKKDEIGQDILIFISHYRNMLGRYVLEDSKIQEICKSIYKKHKKALDLIFEYKPDLLMEIKDYLELKIKEESDLISDISSKSFIRFIPKELDFIQREGDGWTKSKRILLFELRNSDRGLGLYFIIGPGPEEIRKQLYKIVKDDLKLFNAANRAFTGKWFTIYKKSWLSTSDYKNRDIIEIKDIIDKRFENFKKDDLPKIEELIKKGFSR